MGASQVLGPLEDYMQATHRLVKLPKVDRFRFELRQVLLKQSSRPQKGKWETARRRRPDDSPLGKRSFSPQNHYTNVLYQNIRDNSGLFTTRNKQLKAEETMRMHRRKHQSIGVVQRTEDKPLHLPSVVNLTYDTRDQETNRKLRPRLLPLRGRKVQQTEPLLAARKASFSPTTRLQQAVESTPTATPTCITPYLTPKTTRRVIFTKEATALT